MKAFALEASNGETALREIDLDVPTPGDQEVLVEVRAAGVTPTELLWYPTSHNPDGSARLHAVPGHEFSGVVVAVGENVSDFQIGDEVFGMNDWFAQGATAERCVTAEKYITHKPAAVPHVVAAAIPISALTAWQGLVDRASIQAGERVLIVGASGSVGLMAVQIARMKGCSVFASASSVHASVLASLGCEQVLDYRTMNFEDHLRDMDVVLDTVGADTLLRAKRVLRSGGRSVTIAADAEGRDDPLIKEAFFIVEPSGQQLRHLVEVIGVRAFVKAVLPFASAPDAYLGLSSSAPGLGKAVLEIRSADVM